MPQPEYLTARVDSVVMLFKQMSPDFVTDAVLKAHKNAMNHMAKGCLSDYPGVNLYTNVANDQSNLPKYKTARGSSK